MWVTSRQVALAHCQDPFFVAADLSSMSFLRAAASRIIQGVARKQPWYIVTNSSKARVVSTAAPATAPILVGCSIREEIQEEISHVYSVGRRAYGALSIRLKAASEAENERPILAIIGANIYVALLWRALPTRVMMRHFTSSADSLFKLRPWTLLTANFTHVTAGHLAGNMLLLWLWGPRLIEELRSVPRFLELYTVAGVASMAGSAGWKLLVGRRVDTTAGASGAVLSLFAAQTVLQPDERRSFFGLEFTAVEFAYLVAATDLLFAVLRPGVAVMAHVSGAGCGVVYANFMKNRIELERGRDESWRAMLQRKKEDSPLASTLIWRNIYNRYEKNNL